MTCGEGGVWSHTPPGGNLSTESEGTQCYPVMGRWREPRRAISVYLVVQSKVQECLFLTVPLCLACLCTVKTIVSCFESAKELF